MKSTRRDFVKRTALLSSGTLFFPASAASAGTADAQPESNASNAVLETLHGLRSIHGNFQDRPLPDGAVQIILQACVRAANASNNQSYSIVVIKDRKRMRQVCGYRGSCLLLFCADYQRMKSSAASLGYKYQPGSLTDFVTATINASLAAQTAVIAAKSLGIDSLLTNGIHRGDINRHWKLLDLPATHCFPIIALVLGYPTTQPGDRRGRLSGAGVVPEEKYNALSSEEVEELTHRYDDKTQRLGLVEDWDAKGYKHYLDWFYKEWLGVEQNHSARDDAMFQRLKQSEFIEHNPA